ncbi:MAG: hypothetical protein AB7K71_26350 [Polyangiaceae bacterium]
MDDVPRWLGSKGWQGHIRAIDMLRSGFELALGWSALRARILTK